MFMTYEVVDGYVDYVTTGGKTLRFFSPPDQIVAGLTPYKKPKRPVKTVKIKGGHTQDLLVKQGDPEFEVWQDSIQDWKEACEKLQDCARLVLSLEEYKYPDPIVLPSKIANLIEFELLEKPTNVIEWKALYLRSTVLVSSADENEAFFIIQRLTGVPEEVIDKMKDDFRNLLLGNAIDRTGRADVESIRSEDSN